MVSQLFVEIIKCELDVPMVAMGEPDPCREPLPRESRYTHKLEIPDFISLMRYDLANRVMCVNK